MIELFLALLLAGSSAPKCKLQNVRDCPHSADLARSNEFHGAVRRFSGQFRGKYLSTRNSLLSDQLIPALGSAGGSQPPRHTHGGYYIVEGCLTPRCEQRAAAIMTPQGRIVGAGLLVDERAGADMILNLNMFFKTSFNFVPVQLALMDWAHSVVAIERQTSSRRWLHVRPDEDMEGIPERILDDPLPAPC